MNTLAIDIGTKTGVAVYTTGSGHSLTDTQNFIQLSGTWVLADQKELLEARKTGLERRLDIRFVSLFDKVLEAINEFSIQRIVFEDVIFCSSQAQAQLWSRLSGAVWGATMASCREIELQCVPVGTLKAFATGKGNADKDQMAEALHNKFPSHYALKVREILPKPKKGPVFENFLLKKIVDPNFASQDVGMDDNEVDAVWLALYAQSVDRGEQSFTSIWERKKEAKKLKVLKQKQKAARKLVLSV